MNYSNGSMLPNYNGISNFNNLVTASTPAISRDEYRKVKMIKNIDEVFPNEIPTDGSWGIYILEDYSKIYLLRQGIEGIQRNEYSLFISNKQQEEPITIETVTKIVQDATEALRQDMMDLINKQKPNPNNKQYKRRDA